MNRNSNEISDIERTKQHHRALVILRFLAREPSVTSNDRIVSAYLDSIGLVGSREDLIGSLDQLETNGLVVQRTMEGLVVVELTAKGEEVSQGRCEVEGVLKPSVDCPY